MKKHSIDIAVFVLVVGLLIVGISQNKTQDQNKQGQEQTSNSFSASKEKDEETEGQNESTSNEVDTNSTDRVNASGPSYPFPESSTAGNNVTGSFPPEVKTKTRNKGAYRASTMTHEEQIEKFFTYDEKYYSTVDYNRLQQTRPLKKGEKHPPIKVVKGGYQYTLRGEEAPKPIEVRIPADMPCTFHAQDLGYFKENEKNIITVKADSEGIARVHYVCSNTGGGSLIVAHSPEASGWAKIQVVGLKEKDYNRLIEEKPELFMD